MALPSIQDLERWVTPRVARCYWDRDLNCTPTSLLILAEAFEVELTDQVLAAAIGMHGAGRYGAQCGLVEGGLLFTGILGRNLGLADSDIESICHRFAGTFEEKFSSLRCSRLRPGGFRADDPPHLCETLTIQAIAHSIDFLARTMGQTPRPREQDGR
ncbi:C-GCAxxG-C-C family (seleno)protein [Desulfolithobacter sp.]